ncbi:cAMP-binding domain of CRP or a regulatory subunit of cAMP-dependent protein kinases [Litoreibacter ascidiaceicola]|uniref:cAMP-binding domain of CRP or a regulatory subunit of cAMP-dependent protein kinases n=1 Tax=Litoreibacter ascidiaceicola TaxID=1486859 RepID=A0A1M5E907_9RHOB|nr:Crp/Fnr family transcriptional regulator [Litoreibacter ascidiaceicola]SHF75624.1 cAMP-binding domain of CRP or a regulatory subunit of cAMP-dependent protein kinases [Litoreibacter ascidiaceicola]
MTTKCGNCPLRNKDLFIKFSNDDIKFMERFKSGELKIEAGTPLLMEGSNSPQLFTALRGMGVRYKTLQNGNRQVINLVFPGDFIGLQAGVMGEMGHSVEATTPMTLCVFDRSEFWNFFRTHPDRAFDLTWLAAVEEHFLGEAMASMGQRTAIEAIAWALVRIFKRGQALGLSQGNTMPLPYRQQDLADTLGLSLVHTNKTLTKLRDRQLASWSGGELRVNNIETLAELAQMDVEAAVKRPLM